MQIKKRLIMLVYNVISLDNAICTQFDVILLDLPDK